MPLMVTPVWNEKESKTFILQMRPPQLLSIFLIIQQLLVSGQIAFQTRTRTGSGFHNVVFGENRKPCRFLGFWGMQPAVRLFSLHYYLRLSWCGFKQVMTVCDHSFADRSISQCNFCSIIRFILTIVPAPLLLKQSKIVQPPNEILKNYTIGRYVGFFQFIRTCQRPIGGFLFRIDRPLVWLQSVVPLFC